MTYLRKPHTNEAIPAKSCGHCTHWQLADIDQSLVRWRNQGGICWLLQKGKMRREYCTEFERAPGSDDEP